MVNEQIMILKLTVLPSVLTCIKTITNFVLQMFDFTADDMQDLGEIGRGNYGTVNKMMHKKSNTVMAVKVIIFSILLIM